MPTDHLPMKNLAEEAARASRALDSWIYRVSGRGSQGESVRRAIVRAQRALEVLAGQATASTLGIPGRIPEDAIRVLRALKQESRTRAWLEGFAGKRRATRALKVLLEHEAVRRVERRKEGTLRVREYKITIKGRGILASEEYRECGV